VEYSPEPERVGPDQARQDQEVYERAHRCAFRLHLYTASPTVTNGDGGVWLSTESGYLGFIDVTIDKAFSDGGGAAANHGAPVYTNIIDLLVRLTGTKGLASEVKIYGLLEARGAYTPGNAEVFTVSLEIEPQ
jgi:hypothetical protein